MENAQKNDLFLETAGFRRLGSNPNLHMAFAGASRHAYYAKASWGLVIVESLENGEQIVQAHIDDDDEIESRGEVFLRRDIAVKVAIEVAKTSDLSTVCEWLEEL